MDNHTEISLEDQLVAVQDWWRDAGVDHLYLDEPQAALAEAEEIAKPTAKPKAKPPQSREDDREPSPPAVDVAKLPANLETFVKWWMDPETPLPGTNGQRVAPRGSPGARLMLLVPMPEASDRETLLEGPQGGLLNNIIRALGLTTDQVYFASALACHTPLPDWDGISAAGLGTVLKHHITLAKPERVLVFGGALAQMFGLGSAEPVGALPTDQSQIHLLATRAPEHLLAHARQRARLWHRLLQWTDKQ